MTAFRLTRLAAFLFVFGLSACSPYLHQHLLGTQPARLGAEVDGDARWQNLPMPRNKTVVAVYKFRDQTGQYKPQTNGSSFSTAVTQGATTMLIRALEQSQWFEPIERENLGNLLNERKIIRSTRDEYAALTGKKQPPLAPLLFAGIILEGGIISYDSNVLTGGAGLRYFGAGASGQYRQDRVTVYLRAISTNSGKIFKTVYTSKTILSQQVDANLFRFVNFKRLLETETGFTYNEPSEMAVKDAIEKSVQALIYEGFEENLWAPRDSAEFNGAGRKSYLSERTENLNIDVLGREMKPRRSTLGIGLAVAGQRYAGDFGTPQTRPAADVTVRYQPWERTSFFLTVGRGRLAAGAQGSSFNQMFDYAELGAQLRLFPRDRLTPFVVLGGGGITREAFPLVNSNNTFAHLLTGVGAEYLVTDRLGLSASINNRYILSDNLDFVKQGRYNDFYWTGRLEATLYLGKRRGEARQR
jgi:curli production assembly/transport component CsgG